MNVETISAPQIGISQWEPRRRLSLDAARSRSSLIKALRFIFVLIAVLVVGVVLSYIIVNSNKPAPVIITEPVSVVSKDEMILENPTFTGRDDSKNPYSINADKAVQQTDGSGITDLINPELNTSPENSEGANVTADVGKYDDDGRVLELIDNVTLTTDSGFEYTTPKATIELSTDQISGTEGVEGVGPLGKIRSDEFKIIDGGERIYFTGRVSTRINIGVDKKDKKKEEE